MGVTLHCTVEKNTSQTSFEMNINPFLKAMSMFNFARLDQVSCQNHRNKKMKPIIPTYTYTAHFQPYIFINLDLNAFLDQ